MILCVLQSVIQSMLEIITGRSFSIVKTDVFAGYFNGCMGDFAFRYIIIVLKFSVVFDNVKIPIAKN